MKPIFQNLRLDDPERAASNPALAGLLADGWTVACSFVAERDGSPELMLLLAPPRPQDRPRRAFLSTTLATALGAAVGALAALLGALLLT